MPTTRPPDRLERSLPIVIGMFTLSVAALSLLRTDGFRVPDVLGVFMGFAGLFAVGVSIRPENRQIRSIAGAVIVTSYVGRAVDIVRRAVFDTHPDTAAYWVGVMLVVVVFAELAFLIWVIWTHVLIPWGEYAYNRRRHRH